MKEVGIITVDPYVIERVDPEIVEFTKEEYQERISLLLKKMKTGRLSHVVVYADREHFSNLEYLTGYDPRFEESLLIIDANGKLTLLVGNEGWAYSFISPLELNRVLYQNLSLQGQPRDRIRPLRDIFSDCGINKDSRIGIIGFKYFESEYMSRSAYKIDIPAYMIDELTEIADRDKIINFTSSMTHPADGIRMIVRSPKEIAVYEYACNKTSNSVINALKSLKPGIMELETSVAAGYDASPASMFPIVNFGENNVKLGLRSPGTRALSEGDIITLCYGIRGSLVARSGLAVADAGRIPSSLGNVMEEFYKPFFRAIGEWYESLGIGQNCGEIYDRVMTHIGDGEKFGVALNPGHNTGADEWTNSTFFKGSKYELLNGYYLQSDIIASAGSPLRQAILEDGVILADEALRAGLKEKYPDTYGRIQKRRNFMKEVIGIELSEDVLPLSNSQAVFHPYMLDTGRIFAFC